MQIIYLRQPNLYFKPTYLYFEKQRFIPPLGFDIPYAIIDDRSEFYTTDRRHGLWRGQRATRFAWV